MARNERSLIRSLQRGLRVINVVAARGPINAKPIARSTGLPLPTTYHLLRTLVHDGYLARMNDGAYVLVCDWEPMDPRRQAMRAGGWPRLEPDTSSTPNTPATPTLIQSLQRGLKLVDAIAENGPLSAKSISQTTGIVLPTAYHLLRTLIHEGYLCHLTDGRYGLGPQLISVAKLESRARSRRLMREVMSDFARAARAKVVLGVLVEEDIVVWDVVEHPCAPPIDCWPGMTLPAHATSIGKSILSRMSPIARDAYIRQHPLRPLTSHTIVTTRQLEATLAGSRVTRSDQEYFYGVSCMATEIDGMPDLAALGVAYSSHTHQASDRVEKLLVHAAAEISNALQDDMIPQRSVVA